MHCWLCVVPSSDVFHTTSDAFHTTLNKVVEFRPEIKNRCYNHIWGLTSISKKKFGMQRKVGLCAVNAWQKPTSKKCHAFTTQSPTFCCIPNFFLLIEVNPHIWFQQRFLISGRNSTTLFSVVGKASDDGI